MSLKIAVCQLMYGDLPYFEISEKLCRLYCERHGYEYFVFRDVEFRTEALHNPNARMRDICFGKPKNLANFLRNWDGDYVLSLDADANFYSQELRIEEELIPIMQDKTFLIAMDGYDFSNPRQPGNILHWYDNDLVNSGVFLFKNTELAQQILDYWSNDSYEARCRITKQDIPDDDTYDQHALQHNVFSQYREHFQVTTNWYLMNGGGQYIRHWMGGTGGDKDWLVGQMEKIYKRIKRNLMKGVE